MIVIDTNNNVSAYLKYLKDRGVGAIGRYYSSSAWKRITKQEALNITKAGIKIFVVFENDGDPTLTPDNGVHHGQIAVQQARDIGQPEGTAIYFALEHLPAGYKRKHIKAIKSYLGGIKDVVNGSYKIGVYSDGVVCDALLSAGLCEHTWLSASLSFEGSKEFLASQRWSLAQDSHVDQNWDGISVDVNEAKPDFGAFDVVPTGNSTTAAVDRGSSLDAALVSVSGFAGRCAELATKEWRFFGEQTYDIKGHKNKAGHTEAEPGFFERIGMYWSEGTNTHGIDGRNHSWYWSAAFVSWVMKKAGATSRFRYSTQHSVFISQGIRDYLEKREVSGYWTERLTDAKPAVGDIVCWAREKGVNYDNQKNGNYAGHSDVVVDVEPRQIWIIGGNVGDSVTRRPLSLDRDGFLPPVTLNGESLFALMKNRIA